MAKNRNTFAKRQREMEKKAKAQAKRTRRKELKENPDQGNPPSWQAAESNPEDGEPETPDEVN